MPYKKNILFLLLIISGFNMKAQDTLIKANSMIVQDSVIKKDSLTPLPKKENVTPLKYTEANKYNFHQFWHETGMYFSIPVHWKTKDWLTLIAVGGGTALLMQYDQRVRDWALDNPKYSHSVPMEIGNQWGGFFFIPALSIGLITHGWTTDNLTTKKLGFEIAQAALYSETISFIGKCTVGRARPYRNEGTESYTPFKFYDNRLSSFPAGHIDAACALSVVLAKNTNSPVLKVLAFIPAGLTVASRIMQDVHWASDVFLGAALGLSVGNWVVNLHEKNESKVKVTSLYPLSIKIALN